MENSINEKGINIKFDILDKNIEDILKQVSENKLLTSNKEVMSEQHQNPNMQEEFKSIDTKIHNEIENINFNDIKNMDNFFNQNTNTQVNCEDKVILDTYFKYTKFYFKSIDSQIGEIKSIIEKLGKEKEKKELELEKAKKNELNINKSESVFFSPNEEYIKRKNFEMRLKFINSQNQVCRAFEFEHQKHLKSKKFCNEKLISIDNNLEYQISKKENLVLDEKEKNTVLINKKDNNLDKVIVEKQNVTKEDSNVKNYTKIVKSPNNVVKEDFKNIIVENKSNNPSNQNSINDGRKKLNTLKFKREDLKPMKMNVSIINLISLIRRLLLLI